MHREENQFVPRLVTCPGDSEPGRIDRGQNRNLARDRVIDTNAHDGVERALVVEDRNRGTQVVGILDIARTRHRRESCDNSFGTFDKRVNYGDQHEKRGIATRRNHDALGERRIINPSGGSSGIAQVNTQVGVGRAAAADDEARISAGGIGRTEFKCLSVLQRNRLESDDRELRRINCDVQWRRRDRLAEGKPSTGGEDVLTDRRIGPIRCVDAGQAWNSRLCRGGDQRAGNELVAIVEVNRAINFVLSVNGKCRKRDRRWKLQM